jgi:DNA-binding MarR family transcriptional regulator
MNEELRQLHEVLLDLVGFFNQPQRDAALLKEAGVALDRALFPLLVRVEKRGPIGVVELAGLVGRDYTTVSRQVAKLDSLGLVTRQAGQHDRRVSDVAITPAGAAMNQAIDAARERLMWPLLLQWSADERRDLTRLLRRLLGDAQRGSGQGAEIGND